MSVIETFERAFATQDPNPLGSLYAEDAVIHHPFFPQPLRGADMLDVERPLFEAFTIDGVTVASRIELGHRAACEIEIRCRHTGPMPLGPDQVLPATGREVVVSIAEVFHLDDDGLVIEEHRFFDAGAMMQALTAS